MSDYWQQYRLEQDPFSAEIKPKACFLSPQWKQLMELLLHLAQSSNAVLLVTGLSGVGKTTLLRHFVGQASKCAGLCKIQGDKSIGADVLRYLLAKHLGLNLADGRKETFRQELALQLESMQQNKQRFLILIDDAHLLPERTLAALLDIAAEQEQENGPLHMLLFGGPQLEATVADICAQTLNESVTHISRIKPLNHEGTEQYLYHRLNEAGLVTDFPFTANEVTEIYQNAGGIPAKINEQARLCLIQKQTQSGFALKLPAWCQSVSLSKNPWIYAGGVSALAVSLAVGALVTGHWHVPHQLSRTVALSQQSSEAIVITKEALEYDDLGINTEDQPAKLGTFDRQDSDQALIAATDSEEALAEAEEVSIAQAEGIAKAPSADIKHESKQASDEHQADSDTHWIVEKKQAATAVQVKAEPVHQAAVNAKSSTPIAKFSEDEQSIMDANAHFYTLQLMGSYEKQRLVDYIKRSHLKGELHTVRTKHQGKDWYILVYGQFSHHDQARAAIQTLPEQVQAQKPWVRSIASIQHAIQKY